MTERVMFCTHKLGSFSAQLCFAVGITHKHQTLVSFAFECGLMEPLSIKLPGSQPQIGVTSLSRADSDLVNHCGIMLPLIIKDPVLSLFPLGLFLYRPLIATT